MDDNKDCCNVVKKIRGYMQNICKRFNDFKKSVEKKAKDCSESEKIKDYIGAVSSDKVWVCIVVAVLAVIAASVACCCVCKSGNIFCSNTINNLSLNIGGPTDAATNKEMQAQILDSLKAFMENNNIYKTLKNYICYDPLYCFLFALALLCVAGGLIVICVLHCSALKKQALLTYAYDRALDSLEKVKDTDELDGSIEVKELQNNNIIKTTQTKRKDYKKTITEIFESYCQNITAK